MYIQMPVDFDKYIYHFTSAEIALLKILPQQRLLFNSVTKVNDPLENKKYGMNDIFENHDQFKSDSFKELFVQYLENTPKVICFTSDYFDKERKIYMNGYYHPVLWENYAKKHTGVCLVLRKDILISSLIAETDHNGIVEYDSKVYFPRIESSLGNMNHDKESIKLYFKDNYKDLFYRKHYHWRDEDEFRILSFGTEEYIDIHDALEGIYTGYKFDPMYRSILKKGNHGNWIEHMDISNGNFSQYLMIFHNKCYYRRFATGFGV